MRFKNYWLNVFILIFLLVSSKFAISNPDSSVPSPVKSLKSILALDPIWNPKETSPFIQLSDRFALKVKIGSADRIEFPRTLNELTPIVIHTRQGEVKQYLASGGTYKAELTGKYLIYRGESNSILYRYDLDTKSLREFVYLKKASALPANGQVIQWRFEGVDLKSKDDGSVLLTRKVDFKNQVRQISNNHMAERISRFLAQRRSKSIQDDQKTSTLFVIPKPEYIDAHQKIHMSGIRYAVQGKVMTLHLDPTAKLAFPLWVDPSLRADADADVILDGQSASDSFGSSVASAGDFNGDGLDDVIVGAPFNSNNGDFSGRAYLFFGQNPANQISLRADAGADVIIDSQNAFDQLGFSVASAGDFNGDGFDDIIVDEFIFFGRNPTGQLLLIAEIHADVTIQGEKDRINSAGDFNGDGYDDIIVASSNGAPDPNCFICGRAFILFGRNVTSPLTLTTNADANVILDNQEIFSFFGVVATSAGDFNGDGKDDVIVGAQNGSNGGQFGGGEGQAFIFFGQNPASQIILRSDIHSDVILTGQNVGDSFGFGVASAGDFNNDGLDDVIVGARGDDNNGESDSGSAFIFFGQNPANQISLSADADANVILDGQSASDSFGFSVASAGDFNGDGLGDVIVGAQWDDNDGDFSGSAFIFFGQNPLSQINLRADADADVILDGQSAGDFFGSSVASAGDFNGDGLDDVIVGAQGDGNNGEFGSGSAFVFFGGVSADSTPPVITLLGANSITVEAGTTYVDDGATALDDVDGDLTGSIVVVGLPTNTSVPGTFIVTYDVTDAAGNTAIQVTRTVNVVDTTPPVVTAPENVTVDQTNEFTPVDIGLATATDNVAVSTIFSNTPAAGFPVGGTSVTWTAIDTSGNSASVAQVVTVNPVPEVLLDLLIQKVEAIDLSKGVSNALVAKLNDGKKALTDANLNNDVVAVNKLQDFIDAVEAQAGKKISQADANMLIADAQFIIDVIQNGG